ncbi:ParB/RepB/Spo0J family partition protein [Corynebacterium sp. 4HC-13]|uniref:ParB/RepB/Spo0J family partition protein n=1 Tax=Corynebacterium anserum TaxID=2684406 RepID=UPI00163A22CA|nr:ParB/RepB/Spo0J family partition protein [Corynebacterium anserum]MBC2682510.1 ParB/RepB/Spo0J family partition protein [Corynebacterium anserum]
MPSSGAINNARKGGLGRGLGALIPTGPARPTLGNGAADVILGSNRLSATATKNNLKTPPSDSSLSNPKTTGSVSSIDAIENVSHSPYDSDEVNNEKRHSDVSRVTSNKGSRAQEEASNTSLDLDGSQPLMDSVQQDHSSRESVTDIGATYREIPIADIRTNAKQPRTVFDEEALKELEHSIREFGLMQPIVVREAPNADSHYELIMGERRLRAASNVGLELIPAIVRETDDEAMLRDALLENIHRVQLNPLEEAAAYQQLLEEFGVNQSQLAERIGRSRPRITNMIRLLQLPVTVQRRVAASVLSAGHARALLGLEAGKEAQETLAQRIIQEGLSVRATEEAVTLLNCQNRSAGKTNKRGQGKRPPLPSYVSHWAEDFSDALDTKVSVQMGKKRGKIVVEFGGQEDFDRIIELLKYRN